MIRLNVNNTDFTRFFSNSPVFDNHFFVSYVIEFNAYSLKFQCFECNFFTIYLSYIYSITAAFTSALGVIYYSTIY